MVICSALSVSGAETIGVELMRTPAFGFHLALKSSVRNSRATW
jgi:hypothetical protein